MEGGDQSDFMTGKKSIHDELLADFGEEHTPAKAKTHGVLPTTTTPSVAFTPGSTTPTPLKANDPDDLEAIKSTNLKTHREMVAFQNQMVAEHPGLVELLAANKTCGWNFTEKYILDRTTTAKVTSNASKVTANIKKLADKADKEYKGNLKVEDAKQDIIIKKEVSKAVKASVPSPAKLVNKKNANAHIAITETSDSDDSDESFSDAIDDEDEKPKAEPVVVLDEYEELACGMYMLEEAAARGAVSIGSRYKVKMPSLIPLVKEAEPLITTSWVKMLKRYPDHPWVKMAIGNPFLMMGFAHASIINGVLNDLTNQAALQGNSPS